MDEVQVRPSGIEGLGVFAARSIPSGGRIRRVNVVREITPEAPLREDLGERADHCNYPDGKVVLYGRPDCFINHSCDPNTYEVHEDDGTYLVARRDIPAGTEITCDYNINITNGTAWPCRCGAPRCLGSVVGDFFRLPRPWQVEYRPLLTAWFIARHRELMDALDGGCDPERAAEPAAAGEPQAVRLKRSLSASPGMKIPTLYIFSGLPGSGKTTLSQSLARRIGAAHVRIDTIEQALRELCSVDVQGEGYRLAYRLTVDNLRLGLSVVADSCNPIELTRREWEQAAAEAGAQYINIEVLCSDLKEHRRRVEARRSSVPALTLPTWQEVTEREYDAWTVDRIVVETFGRTERECLDDLLARAGLDA